MEGLIVTFFVLLWTIPSGNLTFRVLVWILTDQYILLVNISAWFILLGQYQLREGKHDINDNLQQ